MYQINNIVKSIKNNLVVHSKIFRFDVIKDLRFPEGVFYENAPYAIRAIHLANSLVTVPDTTYHYFSNPHSTMKQQNLRGKNREDKIAMNLDLINYCEQNSIDIGNWEVLKERHLLWAIKHYKYHKDFYLFGVKYWLIYSLIEHVITSYTPKDIISKQDDLIKIFKALKNNN